MKFTLTLKFDLDLDFDLDLELLTLTLNFWPWPWTLTSDDLEWSPVTLDPYLGLGLCPWGLGLVGCPLGPTGCWLWQLSPLLFVLITWLILAVSLVLLTGCDLEQGPWSNWHVSLGLWGIGCPLGLTGCCDSCHHYWLRCSLVDVLIQTAELSLVCCIYTLRWPWNSSRRMM